MSKKELNKNNHGHVVESHRYNDNRTVTKQKMEKNNVDPNGKDKPIMLSLPMSDVSYYHWNKRTRIKWMLTFFVGIILVYSVRVSMSICTAAMSKEFQWTKSVSGMALSAFFCGYITTNVIGGYLADRHGGDLVISYTAVFWSVLTIMLPVLTTTNQFGDSTSTVLLTRFLTGVGQGVFFPSFTSIITKHVAVAERGFMYSFAFSGSSAGTIITGFAGSLLLEHFGWESVFSLVGILSLLWVLWLKCLMSVSKIRPKLSAKEKKPKEPVPWAKFAMQGPFWGLFIAYFCSSYCFYNILSWTPVYFHDLFPESKGWVFNVIPWLTNFIMTNISGYILNLLIALGWSVTMVRKLYASAMFLGITLFSLLLTVVETFQQALFVMSLNVGVHALSTGSLMMNSQDLAPQHAGALHGFMNSCGAFAGFVGVYITGYILEVTGNWSSVNFVTCAFSFVGFVAYAILGSGQRMV